jgi:hypothetical protein
MENIVTETKNAHKFTKIFTNIVISPTYFGHPCGYPQGGALLRKYALRVTKVCKPMHIKILNIETAWFKI